MIGVVGPRKSHVPGDHEREESLGQAVGPNTFGESLICCGAEYDGQRYTTLWYRYAQATPEDNLAVLDHVRTVQS